MSDPDFRDIVKSAAYTLTFEEQARAEAIFSAGAARYADQVKAAHWIHGADGGMDYCRECALAIIEKEKVRRRRLPKVEKKDSEVPSLDGGWRTEHDSPPICDECNAPLDGSLTNYGAETELDHFLENGFDPECDADCHAMSEVLLTLGWSFMPEMESQWQSQERADQKNREAQELRWGLGKLARAIFARLDA